MASHTDSAVLTDRLLTLSIDNSPTKKTNLEGLAFDILVLIAEILFLNAPPKASASLELESGVLAPGVLSLAHASRALRRAAVPFLYQSLYLATLPRRQSTGRGYEELIKIIRSDRECELVKHVRNIRVKGTIPEENLLLVLNKIANHGRLRKVSWNTSTHMPRSVYNLLHEKWPELELSVSVINRYNPDVTYRQMDSRLLSSPLLTKLIYSVYNQGYFQGYVGDQAVCSEWPELTRCLIVGGHVRSVRTYNLKDNPSLLGNSVLIDNGTWKLPRFDITADAHLPALEELCLTISWTSGGLAYLWDEDHCRLFRDAMDWSRMRKLDFGSGHPGAFLRVFNGKIPNLKSLRIGVAAGSIGTTTTFIESVPALECLDIAQADMAIEQLWPSIMKHKSTLKELILRPSTGVNYQPHCIDMSYLEAVAEEVPLLERLGWIVPCDENLDAEHLAMLCNLNLRKVDLFIHLPSTQSDFCGTVWQDQYGNIPPPPLYRRACFDAAITLMEMVDQCQERLLEWITFHFSRFGMAAMAERVFMEAKMQLRRRAKNVEANEFEGRGLLQWYGPVQHDELLSLEKEWSEH